MMKVLHIATIDSGGAYNGAKRLNELMLANGVDSQVMVRSKTHADSLTNPAFESSSQVLASKLKNVINRLHWRRQVKRDILGSDLRRHPLVREADIIMLHWVSTFLSPKQIYQLSMLPDKKVIFVMHDMWLFTAGCHVDKRCGGYSEGCVECPEAGRLAKSTFKKKADYIGRAHLSVTGPSHWIVNEAGKSAILKGKSISYMPNVYDPEIFYPRCLINEPEEAVSRRNKLRSKFGLSCDKKLILFGAADTGTKNSNKGFNFLLEALERIDMSDKQLVVIGNAKGADKLLEGYDAVFPGYISDEDRLAEIYSLADVYVNPSLQESFGYTVCEAMACATPAVAFAVGGMLDQISHKENGYLAEFCDASDLAKGIEYVLEHRDEMGSAAAKSAKRFSYEQAWESSIKPVIFGK